MSRPPRYWPRDIPWNDSIKIRHVLLSLPPIFVLESGEQIRGEKDDNKKTIPIPELRVLFPKNTSKVRAPSYWPTNRPWLDYYQITETIVSKDKNVKPKLRLYHTGETVEGDNSTAWYDNWPDDRPWSDTSRIVSIRFGQELFPVFVLDNGELVYGVSPTSREIRSLILFDPVDYAKQTTKDLTYLATVQSKVPSKIKIVLDKLRNRSSGNNKPFQTRAYTPVGAGYQKNIPVNTYKPYNRRGRNTGAIQTVQTAQTPANQSSSSSSATSSSSLLSKAGYYALPLGILAGAIYAYNSGGGAQVLTDFIKSTTTNGIQTSTGSTALYQAVITNEKLREQLTTPKDYSGIYKAVAGTLVGGALTLAGGALSGAGHALGNTMFNALFVETPIAPSDDTLRGTEGQTENTTTLTTNPPTETPIAPSDDTLRGTEGQTENTTTDTSTTIPPTETPIASLGDVREGAEGLTENRTVTSTTNPPTETTIEGSQRGSSSSTDTVMILYTPPVSPRSEMEVAEEYDSSHDLPKKVLDSFVPRE
jgi:hypothetical protein